jgi:hypothetical protein
LNLAVGLGRLSGRTPSFKSHEVGICWNEWASTSKCTDISKWPWSLVPTWLAN